MSTSTGPLRDEGVHEGNIYPLPGDAPSSSSSGGPLDDITSGLKVWADVGVTLGKSLDDHTSTLRRYLDRLNRNTPVDYGQQASGVYPATGFLVLNLGTPDQGTRWEIMSVVVGGTDQNVTAAGSAGLYVGGYVPATGQTVNPTGLAQMADQAKTLPNVGYYGTRQLVVNDQEYLFLVVFSGTPGQTYIANMSATVHQFGAAGGVDVNVL